MAAGNRDAGSAANRGATLQDAADGRSRQHIDRHAHQRQRQDRPAAHGVHVRDGVGGSNAAKVERVVDDGHEEIGGGDQRLLVIKSVDRRIVRGLDTHQQFRGNGHGAHALEDLRQHARRDLAATATAMGQAGEAGFGGRAGSGGCGHVS